MFQSIEKELVYYNILEKDCNEAFECSLERLLEKKLRKNQQLIILCIGSDYVIGDCLGPLIGYKLTSRHLGLVVYGNLNYTVHSMNLVETVNDINKKFFNPFIIAIDSVLCFDKSEIGNVKLWSDGLMPGLAFGKNLPCVGHIGISGTTNIKNSFESFIQSTRMNLVMQLADFIENSLLNTLLKMNLITYDDSKIV